MQEEGSNSTDRGERMKSRIMHEHLHGNAANQSNIDHRQMLSA
jgi:hypothetical protein